MGFEVARNRSLRITVGNKAMVSERRARLDKAAIVCGLAIICYLNLLIGSGSPTLPPPAPHLATLLCSKLAPERGRLHYNHRCLSF